MYFNIERASLKLFTEVMCAEVQEFSIIISYKTGQSLNCNCNIFKESVTCIFKTKILVTHEFYSGYECVVQFFFSFSSVFREVWIRTQRFINLATMASHLSLIDLHFLISEKMIKAGKFFALYLKKQGSPTRLQKIRTI